MGFRCRVGGRSVGDAQPRGAQSLSCDAVGGLTLDEWGIPGESLFGDEETEGIIMRKTTVLGCGAALIMGLLAGPANAASAPGSCPPAFEGPDTLAEILALPQVQAGLNAGLYDEAHARAVFNAADKNGDLATCWMSTGSWKSMYAVNMVDNNAAPK